jgi:hypothetical protein
VQYATPESRKVPAEWFNLSNYVQWCYPTVYVFECVSSANSLEYAAKHISMRNYMRLVQISLK